jgi:hypothetical protein
MLGIEGNTVGELAALQMLIAGYLAAFPAPLRFHYGFKQSAKEPAPGTGGGLGGVDIGRDDFARNHGHGRISGDIGI